ncbi:hypothetical protein OGAPHI_007312 [Ogataea philodendri]|uniref:Uncharacterized protein n=1 Tax=Ogataea philodendri TaxID=1378263 RepID=A0A9P8NUX9_9ASCO|nr:uncharacterized protein OGAPHI_007312 [Ogataea philodendri]KAH3660107.1 hypothetical protein OGAPHI_007312 [Ogataea philodendri]
MSSTLLYGPRIRQLLVSLEQKKETGPPRNKEVLAKVAFLGLLLTKRAKQRSNSSSSSLSSTPTLYSPEQRSRANSHSVSGPLVTYDQRTTLKWIDRYNKFESGLLDSLESLVSLFDNFTMFQNVIKNSRFATKFKSLESVVQNLSKVYFIIVLLNMKNLIVRLVKLNKLIRMVEMESALVSRTTKYQLRADSPVPERDNLVLLYTEKFKTYLELIGYANELVLNLSLIFTNFELPKLVSRLVNLISWITSVYRLSKDDDEATQTDQTIQQIQKRYS